MMRADFSAWLVTVGVIFGFIAAIFGLIDFLSNRSIRAQRPAWPHAVGNVCQAPFWAEKSGAMKSMI